MLEYVAAIAMGLCTDTGGPLPVKSVNELVQLWKKDEERVKTLHVVFTERKTIMPGTQIPPPGAKHGAPYPAEEMTVERELELWLNGDYWRYDFLGLDWNQSGGRFQETHFVELFDGRREVIYIGPMPPGDDAVPDADVVRLGRKTQPRGNGWGKVPLCFFWSFRNSSPSFLGFTPEKWTVTGDRAVIDARECYAIAKKHPKTGRVMSYRCWIDPERGYHVVRCEVGEPAEYQADYTYQLDPEYGWVPSGWKKVDYAFEDDGTPVLRGSSELSVKAVEINPVFDEDPIAFELPPGTFVKEFSDEGKSMYLVKKDQSPRVITEQELRRGASYTELQSTPTGEAGRPTRRVGWNWWLWGSVALLVVASTVALRR